jgi:hypothetical protein
VKKDGASFASFELDSPAVTFTDAPPAGQRAFYRVELHGAVPLAPAEFAGLYGDMIAMSNPIYVSFP